MEQITTVDEATCWELLYNYCGLHEIALIDKINVFKKRRIVVICSIHPQKTFALLHISLSYHD
jgi:hypothetical protein